MTFADKILGLLNIKDARTDRQLSEYLECDDAQVNQECRLLEGRGVISRHKGEDGVIRNRWVQSHLRVVS